MAEDRERRAPQEAVPDKTELTRAVKALQLDNEQHKRDLATTADKMAAAEAAAATGVSAADANVARLRVEVATLGALIKQADQANNEHAKVNLCTKLISFNRLEHPNLPYYNCLLCWKTPIPCACFHHFTLEAIRLNLTDADIHLICTSIRVIDVETLFWLLCCLVDFVVSALKALQGERELDKEQHKHNLAAVEAVAAKAAEAAAAKGVAAAEAAAAKRVAAAEAAAQREREARKLERTALEVRLQELEHVSAQDKLRSSSLEAHVREIQDQWQACQKLWTEQYPAQLRTNEALAGILTAAHERCAEMEARCAQLQDAANLAVQHINAADAHVAQLEAELTALGARLAQADQANHKLAVVSLCTLLVPGRMECSYHLCLV